MSDEADGYFVNCPLEWGYEVLLEKIFRNRGLEVNKICTEFWRHHMFGKFMDSILNCFAGEILLAELIKVGNDKQANI